MTEKLKFTRAQMRNMAIIAKEEGVSVTLAPDGSLSVLPAAPVDHIKTSDEYKGVIRL